MDVLADMEPAEAAATEDPTMALCELHYFSAALGCQMAANVILPEADAPPGPHAVLYLLGGLSDDHTIWDRRTSLERYVAGLPLMVVMPNGQRGFYTDAVDGGPKYETAIAGELIPFIDRTFHTRTERPGRAIGGLSMGGYGAVKLALKYPDLFCSANSHAGALAWAHKPLASEAAEWRRILGADHIGGPNDCFALAAHSASADRPALRIDCGLSDHLIDDNRAFHEHLQSLGIAHEYGEYPGKHDWAYVDQRAEEAIAFHRKGLGI